MAFLRNLEQVSTLGKEELPHVVDALLSFCEQAGNFLNPLYSPIVDKEERTLTFNAKTITESQDSAQDVEMKVFSKIETQEPKPEDLSLGVNCHTKQQELTQNQLLSLNSMGDFTVIWSSNEDDTTDKDWTLVCEENTRAESMDTTPCDDFILVEDEDFAEDDNM